MIKYITRMIVRKELNKIEASNEALFYDILCNKYNKRACFKKVGQYCCEKKRILNQNK